MWSELESHENLDPRLSSKNIYKFNLIETSLISIQDCFDFIIKPFARFLLLLYNPEGFCVTFSELQHVNKQSRKHGFDQSENNQI